MLDYVLFVAALGAVLIGAEWLVRGASRLGADLGMPPIVIGLTIVAFGTSAPEIAVSSLASATGSPETALGNAMGSNVANLGLVLGLGALIRPLRCDPRVVRRDAPLLVALSAIYLALAFTGAYERWMGALMLVGLAGYLFYVFRFPTEELVLETGAHEPEPVPSLDSRGRLTQAALVVAGLALLVGGATLLVEAAENIAVDLGVPEVVVATTLIAIGTSVPEMAATAIAAYKRQADIAVGGVIGSNIFNLLAVLGIASVIEPIPIASDIRNNELIWMVGFALATAILARTSHRIGRPEGGLLLGAYCVFGVVVFL